MRPRLLPLVGFACGVAFGSVALAEPWVPTDDALVLETLPQASDPAVVHASDLSRSLSQRPDDAALAAETARAWLRIGRARGDPRFVGRAQQALMPWWQASELPTELRLMRASVRQSQHEFRAALADLDELVARGRGDVQVWLERATVLQTLGDPGGARRACLQVAGSDPGLLGQACLAVAESLAGSAEQAYRVLAVMLRRDPGADPGMRGWALSILGEIAIGLGRHAEAEAHLRDAMAEGGGDIYTLAILADLLLDTDRPEAVLELTSSHRAVDALLLRHALASTTMGIAEAQADRDELAARFAALRQRGETSHLRDEARFVLALQGDASRALDLAARNWQRQNTPADARILLEAAIAAGQPAPAGPVLEWMARTGIEDVTLRRLSAQLASQS